MNAMCPICRVNERPWTPAASTLLVLVLLFLGAMLNACNRGPADTFVHEAYGFKVGTTLEEADEAQAGQLVRECEFLLDGSTWKYSDSGSRDTREIDAILGRDGLPKLGWTYPTTIVGSRIVIFQVLNLRADKLFVQVDAESVVLSLYIGTS